jgi:hypothetical protein
MIYDRQAILISTVESYFCDSSLDAHFERQLPGMPSSYTDSRGVYSHSAIVLIQIDGIKKLIIGARTCSLLITFSIHLDIVSVNIGPLMSHFFSTWNQSNASMTNKSTMQAQETLPMFQLKQVQSKFDSLSTYTMCRALS